MIEAFAVRMKNILLTGLKAAACMMWLALNAHAAQDSITLSLNITNVLSVQITEGTGGEVDRTNYDFGDLVLGDVTINSNKIGINNTSGGLLQTYQLSVIDTDGGMILRETAGALVKDEYRISALFQANQPAPGDFNETGSTDDLVTTTNKTAAASAAGSYYSKDSGTSPDEDGVNVSDTSSNTEINLWLKLEVPPIGSTISGSQTGFATIYITTIMGM